MTITLRRATQTDAAAIAPLFDQYRVFYGEAPDAALALRFVSERLARGESVIFIAEDDGRAVGFTQLFPSFSSVRAARLWILNDLYVSADARRQGVARALLEAAAAFGRASGAVRLELETDHGNLSAQALYRDTGWEAYDGTLRFRLPLIH